MESTEKLADDYAQIVKESMEADGVDMTGKVAGICLRMVRESFIHGMERMREEMIRWHDPKDLPERGKDVLLKMEFIESGELMYSVGYWYASYFSNTLGLHGEVIGWREIHE